MYTLNLVDVAHFDLDKAHAFVEFWSRYYNDSTTVFENHDLFEAEYPPRLAPVYASLSPSRYQRKVSIWLIYELFHIGYACEGRNFVAQLSTYDLILFPSIN